MGQEGNIRRPALGDVQGGNVFVQGAISNLAIENGEYEIGDIHLTAILGESFKDHCYKLVAAVLDGPS